MTGPAASAALAGRNARLASWPAPGHCGTQAQRGLCSPAPGRPPAWRAWMDQAPPAHGIGVPVGNVTGATLPIIPPDMAGATTVPRYLIERLPPKNTGGSAPAGMPAQRYRITALGQGRDPAARVVLQTEWIDAEGSDPSSRRAAASHPEAARVRRLGWRELVPPYPS
ncbi:Pilus assembly protein [Cupriavidus sp. H18C1]